MRIVVLATAWGPADGAVNAFSADLCAGIVAELGKGAQVYCAIISEPKTYAAAAADARDRGVTLIPIERDPQAAFDPSWTWEVSKWLKSHTGTDAVDVWVGHDLVSGPAAQRGAAEFGGKPAVLIHVAHRRLTGQWSDNTQRIADRHRDQMKLLAQAGHLFAVGPLLRDFVNDSGRTATMVVPGFPDAMVERPRKRRALAGITFGPLAGEDERPKQGRLAVAAFARTLKVLRLSPSDGRRAHDHHLMLLGVAEGAEAAAMHTLARREAGQGVNLLFEHYDPQRRDVFQRIAEASFAMMVPIHEGFGRTAWEAIGLGVPVIISRDTGVYRLLDEIGAAATSLVHVVDVDGAYDADTRETYTAEDIDAVSTQILDVGQDLDTSIKRAGDLGLLLRDRFGCTWRHAARTFLAALADDDLGEAVSPPAPEARPVDEPACARIKSVFNGEPALAKLALAAPAGGRRQRLAFAPQLTFSTAEGPVNAVWRARVTLNGAQLTLTCHGACILSGPKLGDAATPFPNLVAGRDGEWLFSNLLNGGALRCVIGGQPFCEVGATTAGPAEVEAVLSAKRRQFEVKVYDNQDHELRLGVDKQRLLGMVFGKEFGVGDSRTLSRAVMEIYGERDADS